MALLRKKEINNLKEKDLVARLEDLKIELLKANTQKSGKQASRIGEIKKTIARLLTRLNNTKNEKPKNENQMNKKT